MTSLTKKYYRKLILTMKNNDLSIEDIERSIGQRGTIVSPSEFTLEKMDKTVNELCEEAYTIAKSKGWHDEPREMGTILALIHSEVSEALEADRKGNYDNFVEELADICIRVFDLAGSMGIDLNNAIEEKIEINRGREYKHGKRY